MHSRKAPVLPPLSFQAVLANSVMLVFFLFSSRAQEIMQTGSSRLAYERRCA